MQHDPRRDEDRAQESLGRYSLAASLKEREPMKRYETIVLTRDEARRMATDGTAIEIALNGDVPVLLSIEPLSPGLRKALAKAHRARRVNAAKRRTGKKVA